MKAKQQTTTTQTNIKQPNKTSQSAEKQNTGNTRPQITTIMKTTKNHNQHAAK